MWGAGPRYQKATNWSSLSYFSTCKDEFTRKPLHGLLKLWCLNAPGAATPCTRPLWNRRHLRQYRWRLRGRQARFDALNRLQSSYRCQSEGKGMTQARGTNVKRRLVSALWSKNPPPSENTESLFTPTPAVRCFSQIPNTPRLHLPKACYTVASSNRAHF